jgi:methyl-accepting chemotaxis protein
MFRINIFTKLMLVVILIIFGYLGVIKFIITPRVNASIVSLEEQKAKEILDKVTMFANNVASDLEKYKLIAIEQHKNRLINLTDSVWSLIKTKYEQSKPENIGVILKERGENFKKNLLSFYEKNKNKMSEEELKEIIKKYVNVYRYNSEETAYFWINDFTGTMILHPINSDTNGKNLINFADPNGVYLFKNFISIAKNEGSGITKYQWHNPQTKKVEDKISYVFKFEPFEWIIGTGEYYSVLKQKLQNEVIELVEKLRYEDNNYFYISDYSNILISHPYLKNKDMSDVKDIKGSLIIPPMIEIAKKEGSGFYSYWWK